MKNYTVQQLKDALIALYAMKSDEAFKAYQLCFNLLEEKIGEEKMDAFTDAYGI